MLILIHQSSKRVTYSPGTTLRQSYYQRIRPKINSIVWLMPKLSARLQFIGAFNTEFMSRSFFLYLGNAREKSNFSYCVFIARMIPIWNHISLFGIIPFISNSFILSTVVCQLNGQKNRGRNSVMSGVSTLPTKSKTISKLG